MKKLIFGLLCGISGLGLMSDYEKAGLAVAIPLGLILAVWGLYRFLGGYMDIFSSTEEVQPLPPPKPKTPEAETPGAALTPPKS